MKPGDLLLVAGGSDWESRVIRFGTHSHWTHVAVIMDTTGQLLAEATHSGIAFAHAQKYDARQTHWIDTGLTDAERVAACRFASSCIGQRYSRLEIMAITLAWATHGNVFIGSDKRETCSSLAARTLEHGGVILGKDPALFSPGDLSALFEVVPRLQK